MSPARTLSMKKGTTSVGVDIGTTTIKVVEIANVHGSIEITSMASGRTPIDAVREGSVVDTSAVADAVRRLWRETGIKNRNVACGIAGQDVIVRPVSFPHMPYDELREAIKWEADKYLPFPTEDAMIDVVMPDPTTLLNDNTSDVEVMLVAALKSKVESYANSLELAGLSPISIDIQPFCMMRAYGLEGSDDTGSVAYIDIGGGTTDLVVCNGEHLRMTRIVQIGGNHFTDVVMNTMALPESAAEKMKIEELRIVPTESDYASETDSKRRALLEGAYDVAHGLCLECKRSITYHDAQLQGKVENLSVKEIVLAGGGSKLRGLSDMLSDMTGLPVSFGDPYHLVKPSSALSNKVDIQGLAPTMSVAVGLALRGVDLE